MIFHPHFIYMFISYILFCRSQVFGKCLRDDCQINDLNGHTISFQYNRVHDICDQRYKTRRENKPPKNVSMATLPNFIHNLYWQHSTKYNKKNRTRKKKTQAERQDCSVAFKFQGVVILQLNSSMDWKVRTDTRIVFAMRIKTVNQQRKRREKQQMRLMMMLCMS